jgi:hypothetical protein
MTRRFVFDVPASRFPNLLERLRGVPARVEEKVRGVPPSLLTRRADGTWSAQENVAHLTDLEELHLLRLDEIAAGASVLTAADMENKKTWAAKHNEKPIEHVLRELRAARAELVTRLEKWDPKNVEASAKHPRLGLQMRVVDLAYFVAEHDDAHLARAQELIRQG